MLVKLKAYLLRKWATEFGLTIVRIKKVGDTEYLVGHDGHIRRLTHVKKSDVQKKAGAK